MARSVSSQSPPATGLSTKATHCLQSLSLASLNTNSNVNELKKHLRSEPTQSPFSVGCYATTFGIIWELFVGALECF
jgi:hypothetical protein